LEVKNTTIQNRSKKARLETTHVVPHHHVDSRQVSDFLLTLKAYRAAKEDILFSIGASLIRESDNPAVLDFLNEYARPQINISGIPMGAFDLLGSAYQFLNSKHENLAQGSFYTGTATALEFIKDLDFSEGQTIFDPSCGSGVFLFRSEAGPTQIYGVDSDPIAIMIAKFNYFLKYPDAGPPNLFAMSFFEWSARNPNLDFDYVIGNPPYGSNLEINEIDSQHVFSGESFSYFIELGHRRVKPGGVLRYLVPESLLNVKRHADIRAFLLGPGNLTRIKRFQQKFTGIMSDTFLIEAASHYVPHVFFEDKVVSKIPKSLYMEMQHQVLVNLTEIDSQIIEKVKGIGTLTLAESTFGLGVVTGDNKTKLTKEPVPGSEQIYTGKEVEPYRLLKPRNYIVFDRSNLQQVAPDDVYRAKVKLIYKTISKNLRFALDTSGALSTNSANIVIPDIPGYSAITVMALLNNPLYSFLHQKLFGGVNKVAKENLQALPFPELSSKLQIQLENLVKEAVLNSDYDSLDSFVQTEIFKLTPLEIRHVKSAIGATGTY
jgi:predicted RNA methylase